MVQPQLYGVGRPPDYTEVESYVFKRWFDSIFRWSISNTGVTTTTSSMSVAAYTFYVRGDATGGAITVTLPPALNLQGRRILVKKIDASGNAVTVAAAGSDTIEGSGTSSLAARWDKVHLISNGIDGWEKL